MATILIDGVSYEVEAGQNLLHAALSEQIDLPYFCWHPALGSVGACRQCAVMQYAGEDDERGRLVMACMTPVADGMRFSVQATHAADFRRTVVEWLMMNHPHDCPVCEEGGECHLQDMTVMTGHVARVYPGTKRTWRNQYLGPFLGHEMNRCITCYRCVRYYRDYAGGTDLEDFGSRDRVYFGRETDGVLESEFSGNLVEVCPTGVFTDKPFSKRYTRKWDLQSAPSVCPGCALGCTTSIGERYGELRRVHNRYHPDVNGYFLCDRGRFGQTFVNGGERLAHVGRRAEDRSFDEVDASAALAAIGDALAGARCAGIGSPRASMETNHALARLVGDGNFCGGLAVDEQAPLHAALAGLQAGPARMPTLAEVEDADAILVLGEDPIDSAPRLALALRQAVFAKALETAAAAGIPLWQDAGVRSHGRYSRHPLFLATVLPSRSAELAAATTNGTPEQLAALGEEIAGAITTGEGTGFAREAAEALLAAKRPLVIAGTTLGDARVVIAAQAVIDALAGAGRDVGAMMLPREANGFGVALLEQVTDADDRGLDAILERIEAGTVDTLFVAENDLFRRAEPTRVRAALERLRCLVVLDVIETRTSAYAHWLLPATTHAECEGTFVNNEGRAQRFFAAVDPVAPRQESWRWLTAIAAGGRAPAFAHVDEVIADCAGRDARLAGVADAAPAAAWRDGVGRPVARATHRYSGRTAMRANLSVHEPRSHQDTEAPLAWSMEGVSGPDAPAALTPYYWSPGWNSNQSVTRFQDEVAGTLRGGVIGQRLLTPGAGPSRRPDAASPVRGQTLQLVPRVHVFGSDELTALAPALAERIPVPELVLAPADAEAHGLTDSRGVRLRADGEDFGIHRVRIASELAPGCAVLSVGLPGGAALVPRGAVELTPVPDWIPPHDPHGSSDVIARG